MRPGERSVDVDDLRDRAAPLRRRSSLPRWEGGGIQAEAKASKTALTPRS